jgi:hypothetical protein
MALLCVAAALQTGHALAQEKQHVSYKVDAANSKYTQQQFIDVGDSVGHQVRSFEIYRTFPNNEPLINGTKIKEQWTRGVSDYIDNNGTANIYVVYVLENGDKFFGHGAALVQNAGEGKYTAVVVGSITGGTGKLAGIQGVLRASGIANPKSGFNEEQIDIEYWISK